MFEKSTPVNPHPTMCLSNEAMYELSVILLQTQPLKVPHTVSERSGKRE